MSDPTYDDTLVDNNIHVISIQSADCPVPSSSAGTPRYCVLPGRCFRESGREVVEAGREADRKKDVDRKRQWLQLLSQGTFFTTQQVREMCRTCCLDMLQVRFINCRYVHSYWLQVQLMIDRFHRNSTIGDGELTKADVLKRFATTIE